jgi:hypothetical protein
LKAVCKCQPDDASADDNNWPCSRAHGVCL